MNLSQKKIPPQKIFSTPQNFFSLTNSGLPMLPISANSKKIWESMRWMVNYSSFELVNYKSASALNLLNSWQSQGNIFFQEISYVG